MQSVPITSEVLRRMLFRRGVFDTTVCDKVCRSDLQHDLSIVSSTNKNDHQDITEILLKVALNTIANPMIPNHHTMKFVHLPSFSFKLSVGVFPNGKET
jgi:hypothetical protein